MELQEWGEYERVGGWRWSGPVDEHQHPRHGPKVHLYVAQGKSYGRGRWLLRAYVSLSWCAVRHVTLPQWQGGFRVGSLRAARRLLDTLDLQRALDLLLQRAFAQGEHVCVYRVHGTGEQAVLEPYCTTPAWMRGFNVATDDLPAGRYLRLHPRGRADVTRRSGGCTSSSFAPLAALAEREHLPALLVDPPPRWGDPESAVTEPGARHAP